VDEPEVLAAGDDMSRRGHHCRPWPTPSPSARW
jgi:hypothetical protein